MHPRIQEVLDVLDEKRDALTRTVAAIPSAFHRSRPSDDKWSVAEIIEHLGIVEGRIAGMLTEKLDAARASGLGREVDTTSVAPMLDVNGVTNRSKPIVASDASQPRAGISSDDGLKILLERRQALRDAIQAVDGLALGTVEIPHPRLGTLNAYQWLLFLAGHEARHTDQIREVGTAIKP